MREARPTWWPDEDVPAPPWRWNPSAWSQRVPIAILGAIAALIAAYLAAYQWRLVDQVWDPFFGASSMRVLDSEESHTMRYWMGVPDAALGVLAYLGDAVFGMAGSTRRWQYRPWLVIIFGIDVIPLGLVSAILVLLQAFVVGYWCTLCLVTAVISLVLVVLAYDEVFSTLKYLYRVWARTHDRALLWRTFWGHPSAEAEQVALQLVAER